MQQHATNAMMKNFLLVAVLRFMARLVAGLEGGGVSETIWIADLLAMKSMEVFA